MALSLSPIKPPMRDGARLVCSACSIMKPWQCFTAIDAKPFAYLCDTCKADDQVLLNIQVNLDGVAQ